jgi:hypothetical protein
MMALLNVPNWLLVAFVAVVLALAVELSVRRTRIEFRLARSIWRAHTRR